MKKTQILLWETTGLGQGLELGLYLFYFILNSSPVTHDGACSRHYSDRKNMGWKCQMNNLQNSINFMFCNPEQNIWNKMEWSSKTGQEKKSLVSVFACFLTAIGKV